jgi:hypothetical protein
MRLREAAIKLGRDYIGRTLATKIGLAEQILLPLRGIGMTTKE